MGKSASVLDFLHLGSSLSIRSFTRAGSALSTVQFVHVGSSLSMRAFSRMGSSLSVVGGIKSSDHVQIEADKYLTFDGKYGTASATKMRLDDTADQLVISVGDSSNANPVDVLKMGQTHSYAEGIWTFTVPATFSDESLKKDITELDTTLRDQVPPAVEEKTEQPSSWVLRELRPVSYRLKEGPDSKSLRYGFVAQELDKVLPAVVRDVQDKKAVLYQDLIAVLTLTAQQQDKKMQDLADEVLKLQIKDATHDNQIEKLFAKVTDLESLMKHAIEFLPEEFRESLGVHEHSTFDEVVQAIRIYNEQNSEDPMTTEGSGFREAREDVEDVTERHYADEDVIEEIPVAEEGDTIFI